MKICVPISRIEEAEELTAEGIDELYCGVLWEEWGNKYSIAAINRRADKFSNLSSFDELRIVTDIAHSSDITVSLCVNEHFYCRSQHALLLEYVGMALDAGVDSLTISDISLILALNEEGADIPIIVSTGGTTFNSETARFYQDLGARGIILDRHLTIGEIREIVKEVPGMEIRVFILNSRCANVDGFCTFDHTAMKCIEPARLIGEEKWADYICEDSFLPLNKDKDPVWTNACMLPYLISLFAGTERELSENEEAKLMSSFTRQGIWDRIHIDDIPCGVCALYEFEEMGVDCAKIVGREDSKSKKIGDIRYVRILLAMLRDDALSKEEYRKKAQELHLYHYGVPCYVNRCYYPEVLAENSPA